MSDSTKEKKKKSKKSAEPAADEAPARSSKKRVQRSGSNVFAMFTQHQVQEFKEAFQFIDQDKDGFLSKGDIRATFDSLGRMTNDSELESMVSEAPGPINFTMFLTIFGDRIAGVDEEDVIVNAFKMFDQGDGFCPEEKLRGMLQKFGERLNDKEANEAFNEAPVDKSGNVDLKKWATILTKGVEEEEA